jgi:hypothetical protein
MIELERCPFCEGTAYSDPDGEGDHIRCIDCGATITRDTESEAVAAWNQRASGWVSVSERLPEDKQKVEICVGEDNIQIAIFHKGRTHEECVAQNRYGQFDQDGNNLVPYGWVADGGPMHWFGQEVTRWMPPPQPPEGRT